MPIIVDDPGAPAPTATFTLTGNLAELLGTNQPRQAYVATDSQIVTTAGEIVFDGSDSAKVMNGSMSFRLPANDPTNLPYSSSGPQFAFTVTVGSRSWTVPAQAAGSTHDLSEFTTPWAAPPSTSDQDNIDSINASLLNNNQSGTSAQVDARIVAGTTGFARTANRPITLRDFSTLDFTGATDSSAALQTILTNAGGRRVEYGREGVLKCLSGVTMAQFQSLNGLNMYLGAGGTQLSEIQFPNATGTQAGITGGGNNTLRDLLVRGPMTGAENTVGFNSPAGAPRFYNVGFHGWAIGASITNAYYSLFSSCQFSRNGYGLATSGCYNVKLDTPMFYCAYGANDSLYGAGISGAGRAMTVTGGSFESFGARGAVTVFSNQTLNIRDVYFESSVAGSNGFGINATGRSQVNINLSGCMVYLTEMNRWAYLGSSTGVTFTSDGNTFVCPNTSSKTPVAYYFDVADVPNIRGRIGYDNWVEVAKVGAQYTQNAVLALGQIPSLDIRHPSRQYLGGDIAGNGSPEGIVPGPVGAVYRRLDGGTGTARYVKETGTGTTGWVAK